VNLFHIISIKVFLLPNTVLNKMDAFVQSRQEFQNSVAVEMVLFHSQQFTNSQSHFLTTVKSVTSQVLIQLLYQVKILWGIVRTRGWMVENIPAKRLQQTMCPMCIFMLKDHNSQELPRSLCANSLMQLSQCCGIRSCRLSCPRA
jgi:hypothetical protein